MCSLSPLERSWGFICNAEKVKNHSLTHSYAWRRIQAVILYLGNVYVFVNDIVLFWARLIKGNIKSYRESEVADGYGNESRNDAVPHAWRYSDGENLNKNWMSAFAQTKAPFFVKEWLPYMVLDTFCMAGGHIPTQKKTNNGLKMTTLSSNGSTISHIHDCITFWCAHTFTSWHCIIVTPGMISTMHVYYPTSLLHIDSNVTL